MGPARRSSSAERWNHARVFGTRGNFPFPSLVVCVVHSGWEMVVLTETDEQARGGEPWMVCGFKISLQLLHSS